MNEEIIRFGAFRFSPTARTLDRDGEPLAIGGRALDILAALLDRAGETVSHRELMAKVWRDLVVDGGNLRVNIAQLRKALGEAGGLIQNVPRKGYRFAAPVSRSAEKGHEIASDVLAVFECSYGLLTEVERLTLRALTIFVGAFTLDAAQFVSRAPGLTSVRVTEAIEGLVSKSLLRVAVCADSVARYRVLDIMRAHARRKLDESGEAESVARRHAEYFALPDTCDRVTIEHLHNVRAALQWCLRQTV
jgi:DNA-binding winged helix-turn-helix (wHTH) protein